MNATELKRCRQTLGLTQSELARLLRLAPGGDRSIRHYEAGKRTIPGPISVVLDMLCNDHDPVRDLRTKKAVDAFMRSEGYGEGPYDHGIPYHGTDSGRRKP